MAGHRLGRIDDDLVGGIAEGSLDGIRFVLVAKRRRGAMGIDVLHIGGPMPAFFRALTMERRGPSMFGAVMW
jgi:hypothetical protein